MFGRCAIVRVAGHTTLDILFPGDCPCPTHEAPHESMLSMMPSMGDPKQCHTPFLPRTLGRGTFISLACAAGNELPSFWLSKLCALLAG